jgi:hypothetical protein
MREGSSVRCSPKPKNPSDLRNQQRWEKIFYRLGICLDVSWHTSLGFEPIAAAHAGPKIEHQLLSYEFRPFRGNQRLTAFGTSRPVVRAAEGFDHSCFHSHLLGLILVFRFDGREIYNCDSEFRRSICIDADQIAQHFS